MRTALRMLSCECSEWSSISEECIKRSRRKHTLGNLALEQPDRQGARGSRQRQESKKDGLVGQHFDGFQEENVDVSNANE